MTTNILTAAEASNVLRCAIDDADMLALLPLVDSYLKNASGRDWAVDAIVYPEAKSAARMLLVRWHEDPGGMAAGNALGFGLQAALVQLEAKALLLASEGAPDEPLALLQTNLAGEMAVTTNIVLVFNHAMAASATSSVRLADGAGSTIPSANILDATSKILTINPTSSLAAGAVIFVVIDHAADAYGQTLDTKLSFWTAP